MRTPHRIAVVIALLALAPPVLLARQGAPLASKQIEDGLRPPRPTGTQNAAFEYIKAFDLLSPGDKDLIQNDLAEGADAGPSPQATEALLRNQKYVETLLGASNTSFCDWGVQRDAGWEALLPHLSFVRTSARVLALDARRLMRDGSTRDASKRLGAMFLVGGHVRGDATLISSLVSAAIVTLGTDEVRRALRSPALSPDDARTILNAARRLPADDPFGAKAAIGFERSMAVEWPVKRFHGKDAAKEFYALVHSLGDTADADESFAKLTEDEFHADLARGGVYYDEISSVWGGPDAQNKLAALAERLKQGEFGRSARLLGANLAQAHASNARIRAGLEQVIKDLEARARGDAPAASEPAKPAK